MSAHRLNSFAKKCLRQVFQPAYLEGKKICASAYMRLCRIKVSAENGRRKSGDEGQYHGHIMVRVGAGLWLLLSPIITPVQPAQLLRGLRTDTGQ